VHRARDARRRREHRLVGGGDVGVGGLGRPFDEAGGAGGGLEEGLGGLWEEEWGFGGGGWRGKEEKEVLVFSKGRGR